MTNFNHMTSGIRALAESTARQMAYGMSNVELKEAIHTVRLGAGAVRIGDWDILAKDTEDGRHYDIRSKRTGDIVATNIPYYETARVIVSSMNRGDDINSTMIRQIMRHSDEFNRVRNDVTLFRTRMETYLGTGDEMKACVFEDRLGAALARHDILAHKLMKPSPYI